MAPQQLGKTLCYQTRVALGWTQMLTIYILINLSILSYPHARIMIKFARNTVSHRLRREEVLYFQVKNHYPDNYFRI